MAKYVHDFDPNLSHLVEADIEKIMGCVEKKNTLNVVIAT